MISMRLSAALILLLLPRASAALLPDLPIVGTTSYALNGADWKAEGFTRSTAGNTTCTFEVGVDYNPGAPAVLATPVAYHGNQQQCCRLCGNSPTCAVAIWCPSTNQCYFKRESDLAHRATGQNTTACLLPPLTERRLSMAATVPGDLVTDLERAGVVGDPLLDTNFQDEARSWSGRDWVLSKTFTPPPALAAAAHVLLVFDGIKMGATVRLNGVALGNATNQHRRYVFAAELLPGSNTVTVTWDPSITTEGRYMDCSGGWDWAPYSFMRDADGNPMWTRGIWKGVYLVGSAAAFLTYAVPQVRYSGADYPVVPMKDGEAPFAVATRIFLHAATAGVRGTLVVEGSWGARTSRTVELDVGSNNFTLTVAHSSPRLWWPRGMGAQALYNVTTRFEPEGREGLERPEGAGAALEAVRRVGFRHVVLATFNDTDTRFVDHALATKLQGNGNHTLMFRANGAPFFAKGANHIPMEALEGRYEIGQHRALVASAADGGMNMLRVWGGGVYPPDEFFDAADELGVMVFEDMMYGTDGIMPGAAATPNQEAELRHQVRRLGHHASLVAWSGCNECGGLGVYTDFVITTVADEDHTRPVRSSCPWVGYETGVDALTGFPNGQPLTPRPKAEDLDRSVDSDVTRSGSTEMVEVAVEVEASPFPGGSDIHGPYQHGGIFPARNGGGKLFAPPVVVDVQPRFPVGAAEPGYFRTETGCSVLSSFESMAPTLSPANWGIHSPPFHERNYPCDPIILSYFGGSVNLDARGEAALKQQTYLCMLGQALQRKADVESWRSGNVWGSLLWQLAEIWPTGGWGSLEYGSPSREGQVVGGRWKPLHHFLRRSSFADVTASCGSATLQLVDAGPNATGATLCVIKNDTPRPFSGTVTVEMLHFATARTVTLTTQPVELGPGAGAASFFCPDGAATCPTFEALFTAAGCVGGGADCLMRVVVVASAAEPETETPPLLLADNVLLLAAPSLLKLPAATVTVTVVAGGASVEVECVSKGLALYVWLSTKASCRFADNGFLMRPGKIEIAVVAFAGFDVAELEATLRVEHLAEHMP